MAYDAWTEGYLKAKQSKANKFDPNISIRFERVGNWIVSAKVLGGYKAVDEMDETEFFEHLCELHGIPCSTVEYLYETAYGSSERKKKGHYVLHRRN